MSADDELFMECYEQTIIFYSFKLKLELTYCRLLALHPAVFLSDLLLLPIKICGMILDLLFPLFD